MAILGSLLGLLVAAYPTDMTSNVMIIMNLRLRLFIIPHIPMITNLKLLLSIKIIGIFEPADFCHLLLKNLLPWLIRELM